MTFNLSYYAAPKTQTNSTIKISYDLIQTKFGYALIGVHENKLCHISFQSSDKANLNNLKRDFPSATFKQEPKIVKNLAEDIFEKKCGDIDVLLSGTEFQNNVWKELVNVEEGKTVSYEEVAIRLGKASGVRAVANAIGRNKIGYLIPCHRVINKSGAMGKYRWGIDVKTKILEYEGAV